MNEMGKRRTLLSARSGFTLMEMMLVLGLIVLLAGTVIFNADKIFGTQSEKLADLAVSQTFKPLLFSYRMDVGSYPTTEQGLASLYQKPAGARGKWRGPYVDGKDALLDPWKHEYKYRFPGTKNPGGYDLYSLGQDGTESADDIGNWK